KRERFGGAGRCVCKHPPRSAGNSFTNCFFLKTKNLGVLPPSRATAFHFPGTPLPNRSGHRAFRASLLRAPVRANHGYAFKGYAYTWPMSRVLAEEPHSR